MLKTNIYETQFLYLNARKLFSQRENCTIKLFAQSLCGLLYTLQNNNGEKYFLRLLSENKNF